MAKVRSVVRREEVVLPKVDPERHDSLATVNTTASCKSWKVAVVGSCHGRCLDFLRGLGEGEEGVNSIYCFSLSTSDMVTRRELPRVMSLPELRSLTCCWRRLR